LINNYQLTEKINYLEKKLNEEKVKNLYLEKELKNANERNEKNDILIKELLKNKKKEENIKENSMLENILIKDKEIDELKKKLKRFLPFELSEGEKLMSVIIESTNQKVHISVICKNTDKFNQIESKIYEKEEYNEYSEKETVFTVNGKKVNKFKTMDENEIKDNDVIVMYIKDENY
jgi:hypothetical protein